MAAQQLIEQLIGNMTNAISEVSSLERLHIEEALIILRSCQESIDPDYTPAVVRQELLAQVKWTELYASLRTAYPTYRVVGDGLLIPKTEDNDALLLRMAAEILDGARTLRELVGVPNDSENEWTYVKRRCKTRGGTSDHFSYSHVPIPPKSEEGPPAEYEGSPTSCFTYQYWYF